MSDIAIGGRSAWLGLVSSAASAVIVGFASTILLIVEAARAVGASPAQQASWTASLCFGMAIMSLILSWRYRMPIITAWSTLGAALIATSASGVRSINAMLKEKSEIESVLVTFLVTVSGLPLPASARPIGASLPV